MAKITVCPLPKYAYNAINRCNLPAVVLGSLSFQHQPSPLFIDGVRELHKQFFDSIDGVVNAEIRAVYFRDYMCSSFLLDNNEEAGFNANSSGIKRNKLDYLRLLRGWMFNADGLEAAVLKRWVESRFGLLPRNHQGPLGDCESPSYAAYQAHTMYGLYNTNALESQLDLLYSYCQYELTIQKPQNKCLRLYRGINNIDGHDIIHKIDATNTVLLLNNVNSFSDNKESSDVFGDTVFTADIPREKIIFFPRLLPGVLNGEHEYLVIGGIIHAETCF